MTKVIHLPDIEEDDYNMLMCALQEYHDNHSRDMHAQLIMNHFKLAVEEE